MVSLRRVGFKFVLFDQSYILKPSGKRNEINPPPLRKIFTFTPHHLTLESLQSERDTEIPVNSEQTFQVTNNECSSLSIDDNVNNIVLL